MVRENQENTVHFGGHAEAGADAMEHMCRRLGLGNELTAVMEDAARHHMKVHDVPVMAPNELLSFFDNFMLMNDVSRELPENGYGETIGPNGLTPHEIIDVACADHEGRLKREVESNVELTDNGFGMEVTNEERFQQDGPRSLSDETFQPEFDREPFEQAIDAVVEARDIEGYEALESGLCDTHADSEIDRTQGILVAEDEPVQSVMSSCPDCRTPGEWVGDMLDQMRVDRLQEVLDDDE